MDNQVKSNVHMKRRRQNAPQRSKNYDSSSPNASIKTESSVELGTISEDPLRNEANNIECIPSSGENLISAIWGAEGLFLYMVFFFFYIKITNL